MLTITPPFSPIARAAACAHRNAPRTSTEKIESKSSAVSSSAGFETVMPALLTRTSSRPKAATVSATSRGGTSASAMSPTTHSTRPASARRR
jgi:hypothetical protein